MQNQRYFLNWVSLVLICAIGSFLVDNGKGASSGLESSSSNLHEEQKDRNRDFKCDNGKYIDSLYRCDNDDDCEDGSDEKNCALMVAFPTAQQCTKNQFRCDSGKCVGETERCDGDNDCPDKSDEISCNNCSTTAFTCASGQCVLGSFQCNNRTDCRDESDEICPESITPSTWQEFWHPEIENERLTRAFSDDDIVVYFDQEMNKNVNWFFLPLSEAWKYAKRTYGPIGTNSILYVVFHDAKKHGCVTASFSTRTTGHRTLLDCGQDLRDTWIESNTALFETLFSPFGKIIYAGAKVILNDADENICEEQMSEILFYDIYVHLKGEFSPEVLAWESNAGTEYVTVEGSSRSHFCFRDWFLPIYKQYGKEVVLNNYLQNTNSFWHPHPSKGYTFFKLGQWVHFWSGSAGVDLQPLALKAFNWTSENEEELKQARKTYRALVLHYAANIYTLAHEDKNIAFKFEKFHYFSPKIYHMLSDAWTYLKLAYNPRNVNPQLEVIFEDQYDPFTISGCTVSQVTRSTPNLSENVLEKEQDLYSMKCGKSIFQKWGLATSGLLDDMLIQMAQLALSNILVTVTHPMNEKQVTHGSVQLIVSGLNLQSLMVYDIYLNLGLLEDADRWKMEQSRQRENIPERSTYLFRDWYLEIYKAHDTKSFKVVKEFVLLVNKHFTSTSNKTTSQLNVGEFAHFWSGAVQENLIDLAKHCFKWNSASQQQFYDARKDFPGLSYDCEACKDIDSTSNIPKQTQQEGTYKIITVVVGASATVIIAGFIFFGILVTVRRRIQTSSRQTRNLTQKEAEDFYLGISNLSSTDAHAPIHSLPFKNEFEVPSERLIIGNDGKHVLGSGEFGIVKRGLLLGDDFLGTSDTVVAVKSVKQPVDVMYFKAQLLEIKIMAYLGKHENIASLLATVTKNIIQCKVFFALEYCSKGDLRQYLNKHRENFTDLWSKCRSYGESLTRSSRFDNSSASDLGGEVEVTIMASSSAGSGSTIKYIKRHNEAVYISTLDLLTWARQIACGMEYLSLKEVIHGDLAARNVLLTANNVAKISDFGLSRKLVNYSHYQKTSTTPVPWRWLAIESLSQMIFSLNSDIWSFGVTLWELFTLGNIPYPGRTWDQEFVSELNAGLRLDAPEFGTQEIYNLMLNCMKKVPSTRMPFIQIGAHLERIKKNLVLATPQASKSNFRESREAQYLNLNQQ